MLAAHQPGRPHALVRQGQIIIRGDYAMTKDSHIDPSLLQKKIDDALDITVRSSNRLRSIGVETIADLIELSADDLVIKIGKKSRVEVQDALWRACKLELVDEALQQRMIMNNDEIAVIRLLIEGLTTKQIGEMMSLSAPQITRRISNGRVKLIYFARKHGVDLEFGLNGERTGPVLAVKACREDFARFLDLYTLKAARPGNLA